MKRATPDTPDIVPARWLTTRRAVVLATLAVAAVAAIVGIHRSSNRRFLEGIAEALPESATLSANLLGEWLRWHVGVLDPQQQVTVLSVSIIPRAEGDSVQVLRVRTDRGDRPDTSITINAIESAFPQLNVAASNDLTQRTALLLHDSNATTLALVTAPGGGPRPKSTTRSIPDGARLSREMRHALDSAKGQRVHGIAPGLSGTRVVWAAAPIPGTPLWVLRERETDELLALLRPQLYFSDAVFAALAALLLGVLAYRWRAVTIAAERDAVQRRAAFVSSVSHELRTPLTQIRMYAEMLRLGFVSDEADATRALQVIEREAGRLGLLVDRALTFARTGARPLSPQGNAALGDAVARAVAAMQPLLAERSAGVVADVDASWNVQCDADSLQQVLINLLDNALKYGPEGQTIRLSAKRAGTNTQLFVDDQGPGVPPDERERIWRPFVRGHHDTSVGGSGIGLAIVRDIVVAAGGAATTTERPDGRGARFVVSLRTA